MLRALLWKEWREQRQVAAAGIGMAVIMPVIIFAVVFSSTSGARVTDVVDLIPFATAVLVWPLFAALAGATTNAEGASGDSLGFLLSRPIPRWSVWATKMTTAAAVLAIMVGGSFVLSRLIIWSVGGDAFMFPFSADPVVSSVLPREAVRIAALGLSVVSFAVSVFLSMFVRHQIGAAVYSVGVALAVVGTGVSLQAAISGSARRSYGSDSFLLGFFVVTTGAVLLGAFYVFLAGGMLRGADTRRAMVRATMAVLIVLTGGVALVARATTHIDPATAQLLLVDVFPDDQGMVVQAFRNNFSGSSYWLARPDEPMRRLTGRLVVGGAVTPDGEWLVYSSRATALGFRSELCSYRAVRPDGTGDHALAEGVSCTGDFVFSGDGNKFAVGSGGGLMIVSMEGHSDGQTIALRGEASSGGALTWASDDSRVVLGARGSPRALRYLDVGTGETTDLYGGEEISHLYVRAASRSRAVVESFPWPSLDPETGATIIASRHMAVVDLESGRVDALPEHCPEGTRAVALSPDGNLLLYPGCPNSATGSGQLRVRDFRTGEDRALAEFDGQVYLLMASPEARSFLVTVRNRVEEGDRPRSSHRDFVVNLAGDVRDLELRGRSAWRTGQWVDESRLVITRSSIDDRQQYAYLDVWTGDIQIVVGTQGMTRDDTR